MNLTIFFQKLDAMFKTNTIQEVEKYVLSTMEEAKKEENVAAILAIANELGGIYRVTSRFDEAKKVYAAALECIKLLALENTEQHGTTLLNLASVYSESKDFKNALPLYEQVAAIYACAGLEKDYRMAALHNNISHVYDNLLQPEDALSCALKALEIISQLPDHQVELATTYTTLALRYIQQHQYDKGDDYLKRAEKIFLSLPGNPNVHYAATLNTMGELNFLYGNQDLAIQHFQQALSIIKANYGENTAFVEVSRNLARVSSKNKGLDFGAAKNTTSPSGYTRRTGLDLAEEYYLEVGKKMIQENFAAMEKYMAIGLVGEGSECLGFDDEISEDHDFGPGFCIWLPDEIFQKIGQELQVAYDNLPNTFEGKSRAIPYDGVRRTGVFSITDFYKKYIGCPGVPRTNMEWIFVPEIGLSTATNGKVFQDNLGTFTQIRNQLLNHYPTDVYLKKLAAKLGIMSQSGQYNYQRSMQRGEFAAAYLACNDFVKATVSLLYLLSRQYTPFYKWMFHGLDKVSPLTEVKVLLEKLILITDVPENTLKKEVVFEEICKQICEELQRRGIIHGTDAFLLNHCDAIMQSISDAQIKSMPIMFDGK